LAVAAAPNVNGAFLSVGPVASAGGKPNETLGGDELAGFGSLTAGVPNVKDGLESVGFVSVDGAEVAPNVKEGLGPPGFSSVGFAELEPNVNEGVAVFSSEAPNLNGVTSVF